MAHTKHSNTSILSASQMITLAKANWIIVVIVVLAAFLRTWQLPTQGMLFSDAGHDLLAAQSAVLTKHLPLLGIASSVPRFHQGPLTVWVHMLIYVIAGAHTVAYMVVFSFISILAVILTYEFCVLYVNKPTGLVAAALLAVSPLAVAHARVPYHIVPIPLVITVFLFAQMRLQQRKPRAVFWAVLSWALAMQFELALFGLSIIIIYGLWKAHYRIDRHVVGQASAALLLGFLPQIIFDLTHAFTQSQFVAYFAWVGYRIVSLTGLVGNHRFGTGQFLTTVRAFLLYGQRLFSPDWLMLSLLAGSVLLFAVLIIVKHYRQKKLPFAIELVSLSILILIVSYFAHGGPSEAYFPPFFVLVSIVLGYGLSQLFIKKPRVLFGVMSAYAVLAMVSIFQSNFFVSTARAFNYGPSINEQREILAFIIEKSGGSFQLHTTDEGGTFPSYLDNYRWLANEWGYHENPGGTAYFIDSKDSKLKGYPGSSKVEFTTRDVYFR